MPILIFIFKVEYTITILILGLIVIWFRRKKPKKLSKKVQKPKRPTVWFINGEEYIE